MTPVIEAIIDSSCSDTVAVGELITSSIYNAVFKVTRNLVWTVVNGEVFNPICTTLKAQK